MAEASVKDRPNIDTIAEMGVSEGRDGIGTLLLHVHGGEEKKKIKTPVAGGQDYIRTL